MTHEDQCDLLNQQMNHMELVKNQSLTVPFYDLLRITTLDPSSTTSWLLPKNFIHSVLPASKSSNKEQISVFGEQQLVTSSTIFSPLKYLQHY